MFLHVRIYHLNGGDTVHRTKPSLAERPSQRYSYEHVCIKSWNPIYCQCFKSWYEVCVLIFSGAILLDEHDEL